MISSKQFRAAWSRRSCRMPPPSSWNTPSRCRPRTSISYTSGSSMIDAWSISSFTAAGSRRIMRTASRITVSVRRPRKSIFRSPSSSSVVMVYWVTTLRPRSSAGAHNLSPERSAMTTPAAWVEACRGMPSSLRGHVDQLLHVRVVVILALAARGYLSSALSMVIFSSKGTILATRSTSA